MLSKDATKKVKSCLDAAKKLVASVEKLHAGARTLDEDAVIELTDEVSDGCTEIYETINLVADEIDPDDDDDESDPETDADAGDEGDDDESKEE